MTKLTTVNTTIQSWDEELAKQIDIMAGSERAGLYLELKPKDKIAVIVLDYIFETVYYNSPYKSNEPKLPTAFALGRDASSMTWHENSHPDFAGNLCINSPVLQWETTPEGKHKAGRENRRLAVIDAGLLDPYGNLKSEISPASLLECNIGFIRIPPASGKLFSSYIRTLKNVYRRPPFGVITRVSVTEDQRVLCEPIKNVSNDFMPIVMERRQEAMDVIMNPYPPYDSLIESTDSSYGEYKKTSERKY